MLMRLVRGTSWLLVFIGLLVLAAGTVYLMRDHIFGPDSFDSRTA